MRTRSKAFTGVSALALMVAGWQGGARAAAAPAGTDVENTIIVTGTRDVGVKAQDSAAPIQVVGTEALESTGATNALDALKDILPSFSANGWSPDQSELIRAARLRGMNPGETLILINGKRRHNSGSVTPGGTDQSPDSGSNPADLDMIPVSMIDHVEVLLDGAAAQYGSDAVAGVINIILKNSSSGTTATAGAGVSTRGDGAQGTAGVNQGIALGNDGFLDLAADYRHQDYSNRSSLNCRTFTPRCSGSAADLTTFFNHYSINPVTGHEIPSTRNRLEGSPLSNLENLGFNLEKGIADNVSVYAFGTFGRRTASAYENTREDARAPYAWPDGFSPRQLLNEVDYQITAGIKGEVMHWDWDVSGGYARDSNHFSVRDTYNTGLSNPPYSPTHPGLGLEQSNTGGALYSFYSTQATVNADIRRSFDNTLFAGPLNVAAGAEFRQEGYQLTAGDPDTYLAGGTQSEAGAAPQDESNHTRNVEAFYVDLSTKILPKWTVDLAGRFENNDQTGVGSTENGKLTTRYDFTPQFGVRGTISDGFHAPTMPQTYFSLATITPGFSAVQGATSSPGALLLGATPLKPETSKDVSLGIVAEPIDRLHVTLDAYQIYLADQIIDSPILLGNPNLTGPVYQAMVLNGHAPNKGDFYGFSYFHNSIGTRTRGLDINADYKSDFGKLGTVRWNLAANFNAIKIVRENPLTAKQIQGLADQGLPLSFVTPQIRTDVTKSSPANKITLAPTWHMNDFEVTLRETRYGHADETNGTTSAVTPYSNIYIKSAYITDVDIGYYVTDGIKLTLGGNNVFDKMPSRPPLLLQPSGRESANLPYYTPWGIMGAYFYSRVSVTF